MAKSFYKVNIEITNVCNLQCSFCPEVMRENGMMDLALFKEIIAQVSPLTKVVALHLMGDPLLHPKLESFVEICAKADLQIFFVTNGVLLTEGRRELLFHPAFRQVSFSLHSFSDNFRGKDPSEYLEKIFCFTEEAFIRNPQLFINYRLWNLAKEQGQTPENINILKKIEERFKVTVQEAVKTRVTKNVAIKNRLFLHFDTEFTWPSLDLPLLSETGTCQGLSSHFGILVDGTVVPCCLDKEAGIPLGNIKAVPLSDILGSPRAQAILEGFRKNRLVEELCKRCQYIERFKEG